MRVLLNATGFSPKIDALNSRTPASLLPLVDRPFVQHVVELLVAEGATQFDIALSRDAAAHRELLGDGSRWGVQFRYTETPDPSKPFAELHKVLFENPTEKILLASADRLPNLQAVQFGKGELNDVIFFLQSPEGLHETFDWSGWAQIPAGLLKVIDASMDEASAGEALLSAVGSNSLQVFLPPVLSAQSYSELLEAQNAVMTGKFTGLQLAGQESKFDVRMGNNAVVHPTATLIGAVFLGQNARVEAHCKIGPNVVVSSGCIVDRDTTIENSLIMPNTYVGEALEMIACVADADRLVHTRWNSAITITDDMFLAPINNTKQGKHSHRIIKEVGRAIRVVALAVALPVIGFAAVSRKLRWRSAR